MAYFCLNKHIVKFILTSQFTVRFTIGNCIHWHLASSYRLHADTLVLRKWTQQYNYNYCICSPFLTAQWTWRTQPMSSSHVALVIASYHCLLLHVRVSYSHASHCKQQDGKSKESVKKNDSLGLHYDRTWEGCHNLSKLYRFLTMAYECKHLGFCKIWGFHGGDYEEWCLLGCYAVWLL
jgi:hypothetical protein